MKICPYCGAVLEDNATHCIYCNRDLAGAPDNRSGNANQNYQQPGYNNGGYQQQNGGYGNYQQPPYGGPNDYYSRNNAFDEGPYGKSRGVTALLALFFGGLGVQYFYLGKVGAGIITLILTLVTCSLWQVIAFIQGILLFCMNNAEFERKFVTTNSSFPIF